MNPARSRFTPAPTPRAVPRWPLMLLSVVALSAATPAHAEGEIRSLWDRVWGTPTPKPTPSAKAAPASAAPAAAPAAPAVTPAPAPTPAAQPAQAAPSIPVVLPKVQSYSETLVVTGNAASFNVVKLIARVAGYLEKINFQDGALVKKDDLLFVVQQDQYKAQLQQAQAQLQAQVVARDHAKLELDRYTALFKQHATSAVDVDHWAFAEQTAEANILAEQAQVEIAQINLGYTEVRAPFDGQMGKHLVDVGNVVGGNAQGSELAEITQLNPIYVVANIGSDQALQIRQNLDQRRLTLEELHKVPIEVALSDEQGFPHKGTLEYVAPAIDASTGTLYVRGILDNPDRTLLPGIFVKIRLPMGKTLKEALLAPVAALQEDQGGQYLFVVGPDDVVQKRYVQTGAQSGDSQVITSGLERNDRIVVGELWRVSAGLKVSPRLATTNP